MLELIDPPVVQYMDYDVDVRTFIHRIIGAPPKINTMRFPFVGKVTIKCDFPILNKETLTIDNYILYGVIPISRNSDGSVICSIDHFKKV